MSKVAEPHLLMSAPRPTTTSSAPRGGMSKVAEPHLLMSDPAWRDCNALLVQSLSAGHLDPMSPWRLRWEGARTGRDTSVLRLYVRQPVSTRAGG